MAVDTSIYDLSGRGVKSVNDYDTEYEKLLGLKQDRALGQMKNDEYQRGVKAAEEERAAYARLMGQAGGDQTRAAQLLMGSTNPNLYAKGEAIQKAMIAARDKESEIAARGSKAKKDDTATRIKAHEFYIQQLGPVADMDGAQRWLNGAVTAGVMSMQEAQAGMAALQKMGPQGLGEWKSKALQGGMSALEQIRAAREAGAAASTQANQLMVPGPDGTFVPNEPLVAVKTGLAKAAIRPHGGGGGGGHGGGGGGGGGGGVASSGLTGDALLATLSPADQTIVKGLASGSIVPNDIATAGGRREKMIALAAQYKPDANLTGRKPETEKPLPAKERQSLVEARTNATTLDSLSAGFKDDFASKGILGLGADASLSAKSVLGSDTDSVQWWKNYRKMAELVERHAMFGASLTEGEKRSWASADISPGMNAKVIKANLATRAAIAKRVLEATQQDLIDSGFGEDRVRKIGGRDVSVPLDGKPAAKPAGGWKIEREQ